MDTFEVVAAVLGLVYIFLEYKANPWMWLFSILMSMLYAYLFFSRMLYANFALSIYNVGVSIYGGYCWIKWRRVVSDEGAIRSFPSHRWPFLVGTLVLLVPLLAWVLWVLGESGSPLLDGITASLSVVGIWMLAKKYYQQWFCWIVADILYVVMFLQNGMWPSMLLYAVYVVIAVAGTVHWRKQMDKR